MKKVLLMGNPNVGKSVIFSKLTGFDVMTANFSGTTVSYTKGKLKYKGDECEIIDVPGTYSLEASSDAEKVALDMLDEGADLIICVLDATNLERNLYLAIDLMKRGMPVVYALNMLDVSQRQGMQIDSKKLSVKLGSPVVETVAVKGKGVEELKEFIFDPKFKSEGVDIQDISPEEKWDLASEIFNFVKEDSNKKENIVDRIGELTIKPLSGIPIAIFVLSATLGVVVGGGKALRALILLPVTDNYIIPFISRVVSSVVPEGMFLDILIGEYGVLIKMVEWPFALILPYVTLFYIVISILEDSGYLPRLGVLVDSILRRIGLPGGNIVPFIMGYGCAVPAILGTRASTSKKERLILASLISIAVPCTAQSGAFFTLLGDRSVFALIFVYGISFLGMIVIGVLLKRLIPGKTSPTLIEIPNLLVPDMKSLVKKIYIRLRHFVFEAQVPMAIGILIAALIAETGAIVFLGRIMEPLAVNWLGLPREASLALLLGIIRRELAVMPLLDMNLRTSQVIVGSTVALFYLPCLSVFAVLYKEFKIKYASLIVLATLVMAFGVGGIVNWLFRLVGMIL